MMTTAAAASERERAISTYFHSYETMAKSQDAEDIATILHLRPIFRQIQRLAGCSQITTSFRDTSFTANHDDTFQDYGYLQDGNSRSRVQWSYDKRGNNERDRMTYASSSDNIMSDPRDILTFGAMKRFVVMMRSLDLDYRNNERKDRGDNAINPVNNIHIHLIQTDEQLVMILKKFEEAIDQWQNCDSRRGVQSRTEDLEKAGITFSHFVHLYKTVISGMKALQMLPCLHDRSVDDKNESMGTSINTGGEDIEELIHEREKTLERSLNMIQQFTQVSSSSSIAVIPYSDDEDNGDSSVALSPDEKNPTGTFYRYPMNMTASTSSEPSYIELESCPILDRPNGARIVDTLPKARRYADLDPPILPVQMTAQKCYDSKEDWGTDHQIKPLTNRTVKNLSIPIEAQSCCDSSKDREISIQNKTLLISKGGNFNITARSVLALILLTACVSSGITHRITTSQTTIPAEYDSEISLINDRHCHMEHMVTIFNPPELSIEQQQRTQIATSLEDSRISHLQTEEKLIKAATRIGVMVLEIEGLNEEIARKDGASLKCETKRVADLEKVALLSLCQHDLEFCTERLDLGTMNLVGGGLVDVGLEPCSSVDMGNFTKQGFGEIYNNREKISRSVKMINLQVRRLLNATISTLAREKRLISAKIIGAVANTMQSVSSRLVKFRVVQRLTSAFNQLLIKK